MKPTKRLVFRDKESGTFTDVGCIWEREGRENPQHYFEKDLQPEYGRDMTYAQALAKVEAGEGWINILTNNPKKDKKEDVFDDLD